MNEPEIHEAFVLLRDICDPRGHQLLTALENLLVSETRILDDVVQVTREWEITQRPSANVVPLLRDYSVKA